MLRQFPVSLRKRALLSGAVMLACKSIAMGGATFLDNSTASWRFDPDTSGGSDLKTLNIAPPPASSAMPAPPNYQFSKTFASGNSNSVAKGSIGYVANQTTATFTLAPGTGVTQSDPGNAVYKGDSMLRVNFDGYFKATAPSFGPLATGYVSVAVGGIVGAGGSAHFTGQVDFLSSDGVQLRPTVNFDQGFNTAGSFAKTFTSSGGLSPITLATNTTFRVKGFFEFRASNHGSPSSITPLDVEAGSAPPTATWNVNNNGVWSDPRNWASQNGNVVEDLGVTPIFGDGSSFFANAINNTNNNQCFVPSIPVVPNGIGQRARFTSTLGGTHTITLGSYVTLGALDFGNNGNLNFTTTNGGFVLDTSNTGNASIQSRNTGGGKTNVLNTKIILHQDLDIETDGGYIPGDPNHSPRSNVYFNKTISGDQGVNKNGDGNAFFNALNTYTGGTHLHGGKLSANVPGSLGTNDVDIDNAQLNYNAKHAAKAGTLVEAFNGGQIDLGVTPSNDENFRVIGLSAISGNAAALGSLDAIPLQDEGEGEGFVATSHFSNSHSYPPPQNSNGADVEISDGAMIGHESFDVGAKGNPKNIGNTPRYIFGISDDFGAPCPPRSITIGSDSNTPWIGFGSDRTERTFGVNSNSSSDLIRVKGNASLVSLNETLWLNAKLVSVGSNSTLNKIGKGTVAIENNRNDFHGDINVFEGGLLVDGKLPNLHSLNVYYGASLGGNGVIGGPVTAYDGASINPGNIKPSQRAGTLDVDDLTLSDASVLNFDLDKPNKVGQGINDLLDVEGDLVLDGVLNVNDLGNFAVGSYTLIHFDGDLSGAGLDLGAMPTDQFGYTISIVGHDVKLNVTNAAPFALTTALVPEPGMASLLMVLGCAATIRRRRAI